MTVNDKKLCGGSSPSVWSVAVNQHSTNITQLLPLSPSSPV